MWVEKFECLGIIQALLRLAPTGERNQKTSGFILCKRRSRDRICVRADRENEESIQLADDLGCA
jgi:hypothetical protein